MIMSRLLHIEASPRGPESFSSQLAKHFLDAYRQKHDSAVVDVLDLHAEKLPRFDAPAAKAKYSVMSGAEPTDDAARAWREVIGVVDRLKEADVLVISSPMWNFSLPYQLKHWIDVVVQPALTFTFSPESGYKGLVTGRPAVLLLARGGDYSEGTGYEAMDFQTPYLRAILGLMGFTDIHVIMVEPTVMAGPEAADKALAAARGQAGRLARAL